jgi:CNT family concentrative nucleoside transporter
MGWHIFRSLLGLVLLIGFCCLLSEKKKAINWRLVPAGVLLQIILATLILWVPPIESALEGVSIFFIRLLEFSNEGAGFVLVNWRRTPLMKQS